MDENANSCKSESVRPNKWTQVTKAGVFFPELQQFFLKIKSDLSSMKDRSTETGTVFQFQYQLGTVFTNKWPGWSYEQISFLSLWIIMK